MRLDWTTIGTLSVAAFTAQPNWSTAPKLTLSIPDSLTASQSNKTFARSYAKSGRYTFEFDAYCGTSEESTDLRLGMERLKDTPVACPLWTDILKTTTSITGSATTVHFDTSRPPSRWGIWWIFVNPGEYTYQFLQASNVNLSAGTIQFTSGPGSTHWPAGSLLMPVIVGRFTKRPTFKKITEWINTVSLELSEWSTITYAISPAPSSLASVSSEIGLTSAARLWDVMPNYTGEDTDETVVDIDYETIGFGRQDPEFAYPQGPRRVTELTFVDADRPVISRIESIFLDRLGRGLSMWVPTWRNDIFLDAQTPWPGDPHVVGVDPASRYFDPDFDATAGFGYFALNDIEGNVEAFLITDASTGGTFVTTTPITGSFQPPDKVSALILSRFQENKIQWEYLTDRYAKVSIKFLEMTEEYEYTPTQQALSYCYVFEEQLVTGPTYWYFTSFESPLSVPGLGYFVPGPFDHGKITTAGAMGNDSAEMTSFIFAGNPLMRLFPFIIEADLVVTIYEIDRNNSNAYTWLFEGTAENLKPEGAKITCTLSAWGSTFDQQFHRHIIAAQCPFVVYSPACGVNINNFLTYATIASISGQSVTINISENLPLNYFIMGVFQVPPQTVGGNPIGFQARSVIWSTATSAGQMQLYLDAPLTGPPPAGTSVKLSPGCDGSTSATSGCQFFNNLPRFGGEPTVPSDANPSVNAVNPEDGGGGKK